MLLLKSVRYIQAIILIINCVLPILTTMACYVAMIFAVSLNNVRLQKALEIMLGRSSIFAFNLIICYINQMMLPQRERNSGAEH